MIYESQTDTTMDGPPFSGVKVYLPVEPRFQSRLSIAMRPFLVLPFVALLAVYAIVALLVVVVSGTAVLVRGSIPEALKEVLVGYVRYKASVLAYATLLTRALPAVHVGPTVRDRVDVLFAEYQPTRLETLVRLLLALPAIILGEAVTLGLIVMAIVAWVCGVVRARIPRDLHQCSAVSTRFIVRASAYTFLLTNQQPFKGSLAEEIIGVPVLPDPEATPEELGDEVRVTVSPLARQLVIVTLVLGLFGGSAAAVTYQISSSNADHLASLQVATLKIFLQTDDIVGKFSQESMNCPTVVCRNFAGVNAAEALSNDVHMFTQNNHFPPSMFDVYAPFLENVQAIEQHLLYVGASRTAKEQLMIQRTLIFPVVLELGKNEIKLMAALSK